MTEFFIFYLKEIFLGLVLMAESISLAPGSKIIGKTLILWGLNPIQVGL